MALYGKVQNGVIYGYEEYATMDDQSAISTNKPKWLLVVEVNAAYDQVTQVRTGPVEAVDAPNQHVTWTYTVRAKNAAEIDAMRQDKVNVVHEEATKRLLPKSGASASQQIMALTRLMQLVYKYTDRTAWSQADKNLVQQCINRLQLVETNRVVEDDKVAELQALTDPSAINAYNPTTGWPA